MNRYERKQYHKAMMKRQHTPREYSSYTSWGIYKHSIQEQDRVSQPEYYQKYVDRYLDWYNEYWHTESFYCGNKWKKPLKKNAHSLQRAAFREYLAHYIDEDDSRTFPRNLKFDDRWGYI